MEGVRGSASILVSLLLLAPLALRAESTVPGFDGGHVKLRWLGSSYPGDSAFQAIFGEYSNDEYADLRLKFSGSQRRFNFQADYQAIAQRGDSLEFSGDTTELLLLPPGLPNDDRRWWDLTDTVTDNHSGGLVQRFDRFNVGYNGDKAVLRFGRQAVSWGNGLIYNPMDFFNPFNPTAVDTEYKLGEDMFYGQYLLDDGSDWQAVFVQRRDQQGRASSEASSTALKYHGFGLEAEYDLLLAENFNEFIAGAGGLTNVGGAVVRGDITLTNAQDGWVTSLVVSWSWSWLLAGHNASAVVEYFYNGFGLAEDDYAPAAILADKDLFRRLERGELYTIGRHNIAGSLLVELAPLLNVTANLFANAQDGSALAQTVVQWDLAQNWQLLAAATAPVGKKGTEYGGIEAGPGNLTLSVGPSALVQLAWYF